MYESNQKRTAPKAVHYSMVCQAGARIGELSQFSCSHCPDILSYDELPNHTLKKHDSHVFTKDNGLTPRGQ